ncbi:MAG: DUF167 domain-containing protein [Chloroflexi bacterium]|nr:DUF167 domain-containing protein [Chloroflexota bacterium]
MTLQAATISVKVVPRSVRDEIAGWEGETLKVRLRSAPTDGKANEALIQFLADQLGVSRAQVEIVSGHTSRRKIVRVRNATGEKIKASLRK